MKAKPRKPGTHCPVKKTWGMRVSSADRPCLCGDLLGPAAPSLLLVLTLFLVHWRPLWIPEMIFVISQSTFQQLSEKAESAHLLKANFGINKTVVWSTGSECRAAVLRPVRGVWGPRLPSQSRGRVCRWCRDSGHRSLLCVCVHFSEETRESSLGPYSCLGTVNFA